MSFKSDDRRKKKSGEREAKLEKARTRAQRKAGPAWEPTAWQAEAKRIFRDVDILVFSGPAGSAKTATATWLAVEEFLAGRARKIFLVRPAVEVGPKLGFLPGDLNQKLDPYARPVFDFLRALGHDPEALRKAGALELVPLGLCKGRTFAGGVVIVDEAQDATRKELRLVLGRLGANSKLIITGDPTQADSPEVPNAYQTFCAKLALEQGDWFKLFTLRETDILRHSAVPDLLRLTQ